MLKKINHIGIVVQDIQKALNTYANVLGIKLERMMEIPDVQLKIGVLKMGDLEIELLEYGDPELPIAKSLRADQLGLNHICYEVEAFDKTLEKMREKGFELIQGFPRRGVHGRIAFFIPPHSTKERIEILEVKPENE
ncbi:MAG: VOC family protein [Syntrophaceae bacterium]|nr:VOC family protein [Syntrophaceae bacterium]